MRDFLLQSTGNNNAPHDLVIENGDLRIVVDSVEQALRQKLKTQFGDWFLNPNYGIPYKQAILKKNPNLPAVEAIFVDAILATQGIEELLEFSIDPNFSIRHAVIRFRARTSAGAILNFSEALP